MIDKIAAVIVTHNKLELLKKCILSLQGQTIKIDEIIVVNNDSSDGTLIWLNSQSNLTIITQKNSGSAGGQFTGIRTAYEKGYDWIWCMDTDVLPQPNALESLLGKVTQLENLGFLSSSIYYKDGSIANINIPYLGCDFDTVVEYMKSGELPVISSSFGSVLIPRNVIEKVGFPMKEFFIWGDDVEYTFRIIRNGFKGYLVSSSRAIHYAPNNFKNPFSNLSIRDVKMSFGIRNTVTLLLIRNNILNRIKCLGILSTIKFIFQIMIQRINKNILNIVDIPLLFFYYFRGLCFYKKYFTKTQI